MQISQNTYKIIIIFLVSFIFFTLLYHVTYRVETETARRLPQHLNREHTDMIYVNKTLIGSPEVPKRFPGCIILGVRKAGTNALKNFMAIHPDIVAAKGEPHFFGKRSEYYQGMGF